MKADIALIRCEGYDRERVHAAVAKAVGLLGGIAAFVRPASTVLVKPNLLMAKEPEYGVVTHPEVVRAVVRLLQGIGCTVMIGDGPSVWGKYAENVDEVYTKSGIRAVAREEGAELVKFEKRRWRGKFPLTTWLDTCDHLVNVPKFKTHGLTLLSGAVKNLFGLVPGTFKTEMHKKYFDPKDFSSALVDIYEQARPALTVVDGILAIEGDGPATGGTLRHLDCLLAGSDGVAVDSIMAQIMGVDPLAVFTTREGARRGLVVADRRFITIVGDTVEEVAKRPFILPSTSSLRSKIPAPLIALAKKMIRYRPYVDHGACRRCAACIDACPTKVVSMKKGRITFEYRRCIACFCCMEACPYSALRVNKSLFAKLAGL